MRLASRHRGSWLALDDCGMPEVGRMPGRFGSVETVRLGRGEPVVLIPGLAGGWRLLAPLARLLSRTHEVILVGLRGDRDHLGVPQGQRASDHALDVAGVISGLRLESPAVMGVSFGGAVALELAVRFPRCVGSIIVSGAEARFRPNLGTTILRNALERFPLPRTSPFLNQFFNVLHGCRPEPGPIADFLVARTWETDQGVVAARLRGLEGFDLAERLWEIEAPALVLAGTKDVVIPPSRQKALASQLPGAAFETIDGAGHVGFLTHPAEVAGRVRAFLEAGVSAVC